ncbi:hypothetical protein E1176_08405 [Fulvivirga sp. RKSG066]|uniref:3D domain-containing protein n=1 Tax=Fulvivirga aurantia TaxID=2529383 RepID=UPI0012BC1440|nr:3D domain-containing protein [Fulvivirga aurantia]MTI21039.1 hypothetical protein [Fulvivirga aurantia]
MNQILTISLSFAFFISLSCSAPTSELAEEQAWDTLTVTASAYNSVASQTTASNPMIAAWGDTLNPGMKAIAVSRDLIPMGIDHNTTVRIEGLEGTYLVKDKMNARWTRKIDIYMGEDIDAARNWGVKEVVLYYPPAKE